MVKTKVFPWRSKRIVLLLAGLLLFAPLLGMQKAAAYGFGWEISSFDTEISVFEDASLLVKETIVADFSNEQHHGIFRTIPVKYRDRFNQNLNLRVNVLSVEDELGNDWWTKISHEGDYLRIQSGDPDRYFQEPITFIITYEVKRALSFQFDDHDELYWNATGDEWEIPIQSATATINYPKSISAEDVKGTCFTGFYGSTDQKCSFEVTGKQINYRSDLPLESFEGLTIVAALPKGVITPPAFTEQIAWFLADNWGYLLPLLTASLMYYLWVTRGRDPQTRYSTVMPIYKPPKDLTPGELGTLIDEKADMRDITSTIIDAAVNGYLKIHESKKKVWFSEVKEYEFEKLKNYNDLKPHEVQILDAIFGGTKKRKLSDLNNKFYKNLPEIREALYNSLINKKYFLKSPDKVRNFYYVLGGILLAGPIFLAGMFVEFGFISVGVGVALSGLIILLFAKAMPVKTAKGTEAYYKALGVEEYIKTAEKDRIKFQEKQNIFMNLLPYAMALNLADKWTNAFEGVFKSPPSWYASDDPDLARNFNTFYFLNMLNSMETKMNQTFTSAPRSSGSGGAWSGGSGFSGGFSGGGFGGGGGGSW